MRPAYLELKEQGPGEFSVLWKTPMRGDLRLALSTEFSCRTETAEPPTTARTGEAAVQTWRMRALEPLRGTKLKIAGLESTMTDVLVRMAFADGTAWTHRLTPQQPSAVIPARQTALMVTGVYARLGVEHILSGVDHLLFVLALILITGGGWKLVKTVSAFTLSHSITLSAAALGFVHVPQRPVEAVIALSIVFVATEILHAGKGRIGITHRAPWVVALIFGLLHGFGFAGGLSDIGMPQVHIPLALISFNVGVETGQMIFIACVLGVIAAGRRVGSRANPSRLNPEKWAALRAAPPYAIGCVAMFWVIQRVATF